MAVPFDSHYFRPTSPKKDDDLFWEYRNNHDGIISYDGHLYRIRSWSIILIGVLFAGYLGINLESREIAPGLVVAAMATVTLGFWMLDALNKSLQMVYVLNGRDIEQILRGESEVRVGPTTSLRFNKKRGNHLKHVLKNIMEESVWPFYFLPLITASAMIAANSFIRKSCWASRCHVEPNAYLAIASVSVVVAVMAISLAARSKTARNRLLGGYPSKKTHAFHAAIKALLPDVRDGQITALTRTGYLKVARATGVRHMLYNHRLGPYKMNFYWEDETGCGVIFMNSRARKRDWEYRHNRSRVLHENFQQLRLHQVGYESDLVRNLVLLGLVPFFLCLWVAVPLFGLAVAWNHHNVVLGYVSMLGLSSLVVTIGWIWFRLKTSN